MAQPTLEIGVTLRGVITGIQMICGTVRVGFGTPTHRGVLFDPANSSGCAVSPTFPQSQDCSRLHRSCVSLPKDITPVILKQLKRAPRRRPSSALLSPSGERHRD